MKNAEYQGSLSCPQRDSAEHKGYAGAQSVGSQEGKEQGGADLLERILSRENLNRAYKRVKANKGAPGIDGMTVEDALPWLREHREELLKMMPQEQEEQSVLVVGLGNREVTADALGPQVVDNLLITRHVVKNYGKAAYNCTRMNLVSSIEPGVMAKTGMETAEIISGVVKETGPDVLIVVDALAARSVRRLGRTIQITDTGIHPGSGVGNHRNGLT